MKLSDTSVLITRPPELSADLVRAIEEEGGRALVIPMIRIVPPDSWDEIDRALARLESYDGVILTSVHAVDGMLRRALDRGIENEDLVRCTFYAVGQKTRERIEEAGLEVEFVPAEFTGSALAEELVKRGLSGKRFLLQRGDRGREEVKHALEVAGATVDAPVVYRNVTPSPSERERLVDVIAEGEITVVLFASPSAARNFAAIVPAHLMLHPGGYPKVVVIGPTTAAAVRELGFHVDAVAEESSVHGLMSAIVSLKNP
jgi:uroporphyrinogen III methyltransferase/synthase